jgi:hypothetical protein
MIALSLFRFGIILNAYGITLWHRTNDPLKPYRLTAKRFGPFTFMRERVSH